MFSPSEEAKNRIESKSSRSDSLESATRERRPRDFLKQRPGRSCEGRSGRMMKEPWPLVRTLRSIWKRSRTKLESTAVR